MNSINLNKDRKNRLFLLVLIVVFFGVAMSMVMSMSIGTISAASVDNSTGNDGADGSVATPVKTIEKGINITPDNGEVEINGKFSGNGNTNLWIKKNVTIKSKDKNNKAIIDGGKFGNFVNLYPGCTLTLKDLMIINGGNAINVLGTKLNNSNLVIINCSFSNWTSGVIQHNYGNISIYDSNFTNNSYMYSGGVIYHRGTGIINIDNSNFINNKVGGSGGAIFCGNNNHEHISGPAPNSTGLEYQTLVIKNSNFTGNRAEGNEYSQSGAIEHKYGYMTIINCNFTDNFGYNAFGAVYQYDGELTILDSKFLNNSATSPRSNGGAVCHSWGTLIVRNTDFINNSAVLSSGGLFKGNGSTEVSNCFFDGNYANQSSAIGLYFSTAVIRDSIFQNHNRTKYDTLEYQKPTGTIYVQGDALITGCKFMNNYLSVYVNGICEGVNITNSSITNGTHGIYFNGYRHSIINTNITNHTGVGVVLMQTFYTHISNSNINNNKVAIWGGYHYQRTDVGEMDYSWYNNNIKNNEYVFVVDGFYNEINNLVIRNDGTPDNKNNVYSGNTNGVLITAVNKDTLNNGTYMFNSTFKNWSISYFPGFGLAFNGSAERNTFINGSIFNNGVALIMNGTNNSISTFNIYNNKEGVTIDGVNNNLTYNRIFNNTQTTGFDMINKGINTDANLNWWGQNVPKLSNSDPNAVKYWYIIELSANDFKTRENATRTHNIGDPITLTYGFITNEEVDNDAMLLPYFEVKITGENGNTITKDIRNSQYSYDVMASAGESYKIGGISDNENILLTINIPGIPNPPEGPENETNETNETNGAEKPTPGPQGNGTEEPNPTPTPSPVPSPESNGTEPTSPAKSAPTPAANAAMKQTGIPFVLLVLAILSVFGVAIRRK